MNAVEAIMANIDGLIARDCVDVTVTVPPGMYRAIQADIVANDRTGADYEIHDNPPPIVITYRGARIEEDTTTIAPYYRWSEL